ncbi:hypothetical protein BHE74_00000669 [Ensete ventricosum]|nr:hypothetical protein BHE74_00000669 [Ensete ventricosum]
MSFLVEVAERWWLVPEDGVGRIPAHRYHGRSIFVDHMLDLTAFVISGVATSYGESVGAEAWHEGMVHHETLMTRAAVVELARRLDGSTSNADVSSELVRMCIHLRYRRGCRPGVDLGDGELTKSRLDLGSDINKIGMWGP